MGYSRVSTKKIGNTNLWRWWHKLYGLGTRTLK
jgi:hypothetical protein